jgi:hypothetical protein
MTLHVDLHPADSGGKRCSVAGCERQTRNPTAEWCELHYSRWRYHGDVHWTPPSAADRLWRRVDRQRPSGCWLWLGKTTNGYGYIRVEQRLVTTHRFAYELLVGPIPAGLELDHLCRTRHCCNPMHLEPVTKTENIRRGDSAAGLNARKTHCPSGHEYSAENTYRSPAGARYCRECSRQQHRRAYEAAAC